MSCGLLGMISLMDLLEDDAEGVILYLRAQAGL
jgi:hypothetical protein